MYEFVPLEDAIDTSYDQWEEIDEALDNESED